MTLSLLDSYDYIVVGGGSSGCIAAARLAEAKIGSVLLLELGEPAENNPETLTAEGYKYAFSNNRVIWERFTVRQKHCSKRRLFAGSGKGMGGSGSVNGMVYTRGDKRDYEQWPEGWHWQDLLPSFEAIEERLRPHRRSATNFTSTAIEAAKAVGFQFKEDLNDGDLAGYFGYEWMNYEGEQRRSSYVAFLKDRSDLNNLAIRTGACVHKLLFSESREVSGVRCEINQQLRDIKCTKEVVLCAGSLETPKLLMLSGIGPKEQLEALGIPVLVDDARIGSNFHDHPNVTLFFKGKKEVDAYFPQLYGFDRTNPDTDLPSGQADTCYVMYPVRSSFHEAMKRMLPAIILPKLLYDLPVVHRLLRGLIDFAFGFGFVQRYVNHMYGIVVVLGKPKSRGRVSLASSDPRADLAIDPNYYAEPSDLDTMLKGVAKARAMAAAPAFAAWGNKALIPGASTKKASKIVKWIHSATMTTFHYSGTCQMGPEDNAPVDIELRLKCVTGVRIGDASATPIVPVSAMNAPSMLIGYRAAEFIVATAIGR